MSRVVFTYQPTEKQMIFHKTKAMHKLYGGAAGWWKTDWLIAELMMMCMKYSGIKALLLRRTYGEVQETINERLPKMFKTEDGTTPYRISKNIVHFNGSQIVLWYWQDDRRNDRYFSTEYDIIAVDELTRTIYKKTDLQKLLIRNRTSKEHLFAAGFKPYFMAGTNPGGLWHTYVKELFIDRKPRSWFTRNDFAFVPATLDDNEHLTKNDPNYVKRLDGMSDENLRRAMRHWDWNIFEWQFFSEFFEFKHVVPMYRPSGNTKRCILCLDYWYRSPSAVYMIRTDNDGQIWVTHELYVKWLLYEWLWEAIKQKYSSFDIEYVVSDPAIFANNWSESSWAEVLARVTWYRIIRWDNNRQAGWTLMKTLYAKDMLFIQRTCTNYILETIGAVYDDKKDNDLNTHWDDHGLDGVRYWIMDVAGYLQNKFDKSIANANESLTKDDDDNLLSVQF